MYIQTTTFQLDTAFQTTTYNTPAGYFIAQIVVKNDKNKTVDSDA